MDAKIRFPQQETTALIKQKRYPTKDAQGNEISDEDSKKVVQDLLDPENDLADRVEELMISFEGKRQYVIEESDEHGNHDICSPLLDPKKLETILQRVKNLKTFTWLVNQAIPPVILSKLQQSWPECELRILKREKTDPATHPPQLERDLLTACPLRQFHMCENDFGSAVYTWPAPHALRLHLLVPRYPASQTDESKAAWHEAKRAYALAALRSLLPGELASIELSDYHGRLAELLPAVLERGESVRTLKLHTLPNYAWERPRPSFLGAAQLRELGARLTRLEHLEMDLAFHAEDDGDATAEPFVESTPELAAVARFPVLRRLKLWVEVPMEKSFFQRAYVGNEGSGLPPPPLKDHALLKAAENIYKLLKAENGKLELEELEVRYTRLDTMDRSGKYPRYCPVTVLPSGEGGNKCSTELGKWADDFPESDITRFLDFFVGFIY